MISSFEHLYDNFNWKAVMRSPKLLRNLGFLLVAFVAIRLGSFIPLPGVDGSQWTAFWTNSPFAHFTGLF